MSQAMKEVVRFIYKTWSQLPEDQMCMAVHSVMHRVLSFSGELFVLIFPNGGKFLSTCSLRDMRAGMKLLILVLNSVAF